MSTLTQTPALMHFPLARRLAMAGWRIRLSEWSIAPDPITMLTPWAALPGLKMANGKKLAWLEYEFGLWRLHTWQTQGTGDATEAVPISRIVEASDFTRADMLSENWTILPPGCSLKDQACACAGLPALRKVPGYPAQAVADGDAVVTFDLFAPNARMGMVGCEVDTSGTCSCAQGNASRSSGGAITSIDNFDGGGNTPNNGTGGGGTTLVGGSGGGGGGGANTRERPVRTKPAKTYTVSVSAECSLGECIPHDQSGVDALAGAQVFGTFGLVGVDDGVIWWYKVKFQGAIIATGNCSPGESITIPNTPIKAATAGQSYPVVVDCHKPGAVGDDATGNGSCDVPDWCGPEARREPPRERPRSPRTPRRRDDRRVVQRRARRGSITVDVSCEADRAECYTALELEDGKVPSAAFSGTLRINCDDEIEGDWDYHVFANDTEVTDGTCHRNEDVPFTFALFNRDPGLAVTVRVEVQRQGNPGDGQGQDTTAIAALCRRDSRRTVRRRPAPPRRPRRPDDRRRDTGRRRDPVRRRPPPSSSITASVDADRTICYTEGEVSGGIVPPITFSGTFTVNNPDGTWDYVVTRSGDTIASGTCAGNGSVDFTDTITDAAAGDHPSYTIHADRVDAEGVADGGALGNVPEACPPCDGDHEHRDSETHECLCDEGYYRDGSDVCVAEPTCGDHEHVDPETHECVCDSGYYDDGDGNCIAEPTCGDHEHVDPETHECVCDSGYHDESGTCVPDITCDGAHEHLYTGTNECVCDEGYYRDGSGDCVAIPECGAHEHWDGSECVCDSGYHDEGGTCVPDITCTGAHEHLDTGTNECVCDEGYYRDGGGDCVALPECGANEHLDTGTNECVCDDGYYRNGTGDCAAIPECGSNKHWDGADCVCDSGYHDDGTGNCVADE